MDLKSARPPAAGAPAATRRALLEAATAVFAAAGYRNATVRDICRRADANVAAVNYHFGDKASLYRAVLRQVHQQANQRHPLPHDGDAGMTPAQRLGAFIKSLLFRLLDPGPYALGSRLLLREMMEPTVALDAVVRENVRPIADELRVIVTAFLGPAASEEQVRFCGMSIVSQCLFYPQCQPVIRKLFPDLKLDGGDIDALAAHLTRFCLAGLQRAARSGVARPAGKPVSPDHSQPTYRTL